MVESPYDFLAVTLAVILKRQIMKTLMPPYTDLSLDLSYVKAPFEDSKINAVFQKYFTTVNIHKKQMVDIQFTMCNAYLIQAMNLKNLSPHDNITLSSTKATLVISANIFYLLVELGSSHILGSSIVGYLKKDLETFNKIGGGRFVNNLSNIILSLEEDELGRFYILISNRQDLLSIDELFNLSRQILNS